ncbi:DUF4169 family protein [Hoeflea sp. WL0058]|uniref:DUF4169 family protein n=1 Tax=Flavimaribacter sediminis TaxID=2865987 RepID=A0AAE2ZJQ6_9HYPH|nr:DUF4169 family protein [Flavimaribacter sediminis]MBW8635805.1 DUF4169 family protein [Flavimaribacter sediminis]
MTSNVVNLRQARKRKARDEKDRQAEANRIAFGRTKAEKSATQDENLKSLRDHEQKRLEKSPRDSD